MGGINSTVPLVTLNISGLNAPNKSICAQLLSQVQLFATLWTVAHWGPLSIGFFRQEYWTRLPFPPPGDLPNPGTESVLLVPPALQGDSLPPEPSGKDIQYQFFYRSSFNTSWIQDSNVMHLGFGHHFLSLCLLLVPQQYTL